MKRILFFKIGAIGDVLMTTPLVRQVRKRFPNAKIDYLVGKTASQVLKGNKNITGIYRFNESIFFDKKFLSYLKLVQKIKRKKYDIIFVLDKSWAFNLTARLFGIKNRIGFNRLGKEGIFLTHKVKYKKVRHEIFYYLDLAKNLGLRVNFSNLSLDIFPSRQDTQIVLSKLRGKNFKSYTVLINGGGSNPGESTRVRMLPDRLFMKLVEHVSKKSDVVFIGSSDERKYYDTFVLNNFCHNFAGKTSLLQSAVIMKNATKVITTDCGPMHISAAVNTNTIAIFGPTHPARKAPFNASYIWKDHKLYRPGYDLFGRVPHGSFFNTITIRNLFID